MVEKEKKPYGYIYRATNVVNYKVYVGQTTTSRWKEGQNPIKERWKEEVGEAYRKQARGENLRYVENAITKYGPENFELTQQDIAYSQEDLDQKETKHIRDYDSMNPDKGYNLKEGGMGGRLSEQAKENLSKVITDKYQNDLEYREKQTKERQERAIKNPEWHQKMTEINRERGKDPQWREKMSQVGKNKWQERDYNEKQSKERKERAIKNPEWHQKMTEINRKRANNPQYLKKMTEITRERAKNPGWREKLSLAGTNKWRESEYREKQSKERRKRAKDPEWLEKMREIGKQYRKEIPDKREFLKDIKEKMLKKDMLQKYDMGKSSFGKRIQEMFGPNGPKNYTELKEYMKNRNVNDVLKDIEERAKENEPKPESEKDNMKEKEGSKPREKLKEGPKDDEKEKVKNDKIESPKDDERGSKPENGTEDVNKETKQENPDDNTIGDNPSEEASGKDVKPEEKDYAGIDKDTSKEVGTEKKSDIGGIMETSSIRDSIDRNTINIKESKEKAPTRKDGEVPKLTSGIEVTGDPTAKRLAVPQKSTGKEGKHPDLAGLNLNLNLNSVDSSELFSGGDGGGGGGSTPDYDGIDAVTQETDEESETKGEDGSEGRESNYET